MELRPELVPPVLDEEIVARLAKLADQIDGAAPGEWEGLLEEFNRGAGTSLGFADFQGIYGGEDHATWVRRVPLAKAIKPAGDVTREELIEIVRRAMPQNGLRDYEAYMAIFDANVVRPHASSLIYDPPDATIVDPTADQVVGWALDDG
jgi:hypothetical protein